MYWLLYVILICFILTSSLPLDLYHDRIDKSRGSQSLCTNNSHIYGGNWKLNITDIYNITKGNNKTFVCCGGGIDTTYYKDDHLNVKEGICSSNSNEVTHNPFLLEQGDVIYNAQCGDDCCICDREENTRYNATDRELYQWIPNQCYLIQWNADLFCKLLGNRKILFVGDSTMQQTASTLMSMITTGRAACAPQITYGWSTHLVYSRFKNNLKDFIERSDADIVILTAGAHLKEIGDVWGIFMALEEDIRVLRLNKKNTQLIWKTQNPGHLNCHMLHKPLSWNEHSPYENDTDKYNWKEFKKYDDIAREYTKLLNISIIDMSPLYLRPDGHVYGIKEDCLHYCQPGPLNLFSQLLLQKLYTLEI